MLTALKGSFSVLFLFFLPIFHNVISYIFYEKVQVGNDQEKAQSERNSHSENRGGKKQIDNKVRYLHVYLENIS